MQPSMFNVQVPLAERNEVYLMNTFSDAQLLVTPDVTDLIARIGRGLHDFTLEERETVDALTANGFLVSSREQEQQDPAALPREDLTHLEPRDRQHHRTPTR